MPLFVAYEMTDGRSMAAIGLVASVVVNSGPYQPASYSTYSRPRATAKSTPARPAAVLSSQRKTLPGLIHEVSARALGGARLRISSALSTSSAWVEPTTIASDGVAKGVVTLLVGSSGGGRGRARRLDGAGATGGVFHQEGGQGAGLPVGRTEHQAREAEPGRLAD